MSSDISSKRKRSLLALVFSAMLAFSLMGVAACTPTDADTGSDSDTTEQTEQASTPNTGGFTVEDTAVVEVDIKE